MNIQEFNKQMDRLRSCFKDQFSSERVKLIWSRVHDLDIRWLEKVVTNAIMSGYGRVDFAEAAAHERARQRSLRLAEDVSKAHEKLKENISDQGLDHALQAMGANSLLDAILTKNSRK